MNIDSTNDTVLRKKLTNIIDYCYTQACITNQYTKWWDDMKSRISIMVRTYEDAKVSQLKSQTKTDELIVNPSNGHSKEIVDQAKKRIKTRNQEKRQTSYLINKSVDQLEGSKLTRFQFRVKHFTSYILSSQVSKIKDATGQLHITQKTTETAWDKARSYVFRHRDTDNEAKSKIFDNVHKKLNNQQHTTINEPLAIEELVDDINRPPPA